MKDQRGKYERAHKRVSAEIFCCSIVSDLRDASPAIIETVDTTLYGGVAQLGEHLPCKQGVKGSIPFISTTGSAGPNTRRTVTEAHGYQPRRKR